MAAVQFPSLSAGDVVEVDLIRPGGGADAKRLLVDTGFTGNCGLVLDKAASEFAASFLPAARAGGALAGEFDSIIVTCRIPALGFERDVIALLADLSELALPPGVEGLAGLTFLRHFARWGAERLGDGGWQFYLET